MPFTNCCTRSLNAPGFLICFVDWTAETLILVGVCRIIWRPSDTRVPSFRNLIPDRTVLGQLLIFPLFITLLIFALSLLVAVIARDWPSHRVIALPVWPLMFYFRSMLPLMIIDRATTFMGAVYEVCSRLKHDWRTLLKLALVAEACLLIVILAGIQILEIAPDMLLVDHFGSNIYWTFGSLINGAMVAVLYREMYGLSSLVTPQELSRSYPSVPQAHL